jgi:hypothetical protein
VSSPQQASARQKREIPKRVSIGYCRFPEITDKIPSLQRRRQSIKKRSGFVFDPAMGGTQDGEPACAELVESVEPPPLRE